MARLAAPMLAFVIILAGCTSSTSESDKDTLPDSAEQAGWTVTVDLMDKRVRYTVTSDPTLFDTDDDGVSDYDEFIRGLDPRKPDTDEDGLWDCQEIFHTNLTECLDPDFHDEDGGTNTDPLIADSDPGRGRYAREFLPFEDLVGDLPEGKPRTGDGLSDGQEILGLMVDLPGERSRFVKLDPRNGDTDGDFLDDGAEVLLLGTDPLVPDTDGDGCMDGQDVYPAQVDRYDVGFQEFTLKKDFGGGGGDILLRGHLADHSQFVPAMGETTRYRTDDTVQVATPNPTTVAAAMCNYNHWDPWTVIQILAFHNDDDVAVILDIGLDDLPEGQFWWNMRDDVLAETRLGEPLEQPYVLEGPDGRIVFDPVPVLA